ncbi:MAG: serine hydroxymethyltransferase [Patescibacteria group bacterium]|nr:serine hydroxymethyltransferase [Patescibacteria group bacterium]MDD5715825.1 serine hydroxymethyltransferase [Patescibacteria group bacterium]
MEHHDAKLDEALAAELARQQNGLEMIPSENFVSPAVLRALGSVLTNKYSEGYPGKRYYGGNEFIDVIENLAISRAKKLFGVQHANVQPYSGSPANQAVYYALLKPGEKVMGMSLTHGGHLTHGWKVSFSGRYYHSVPYGVDKETHLIDYDVVLELARKERPQLIIAGATAYPRAIDFKAFGQIAAEVGAYLLTDIAHIAGLIIAEVHQSPVPYADVVTTTTHKTLRGPRGAIIMCPRIEDRLKEKYHEDSKWNLAELIDRAVFPGLQGGPHNHQTAAIATALDEASTPAFKRYGEQIVKNARALADQLLAHDFRLITGGTDNHLILIDLSNKNLSGGEAETLLDEVGITVNKNTVPYDTRKPMDPSGVRLGTPALTTRGFTEVDMKLVADVIADVIHNPKKELVKESVRKKISELTQRHPLYAGLS